MPRLAANSPADAAHPVARFSSDTYVKIISTVIVAVAVHTGTLLGVAWAWTTHMETRMVALEIKQEYTHANLIEIKQEVKALPSRIARVTKQ